MNFLYAFPLLLTSYRTRDPDTAVGMACIALRAAANSRGQRFQHVRHLLQKHWAVAALNNLAKQQRTEAAADNSREHFAVDTAPADTLKIGFVQRFPANTFDYSVTGLVIESFQGLNGQEMDLARRTSYTFLRCSNLSNRIEDIYSCSKSLLVIHNLRVLVFVFIYR